MKKIKHNIHKPDKNRLWRKIEPFLPNNESYHEINRKELLKALSLLPEIHPEKNVWRNIENRITPAYLSKFRIYFKYAAGVAAAAIILYSLQILFHNRTNNYSVNQAMNNANSDIEAFLANICVNNPHKCKHPDFLELKNEILTLQDEKSEIYDQVFYNKNDQDIKKTMEKIDAQIIILKKQIEGYVSF